MRQIIIIVLLVFAAAAASQDKADRQAAGGRGNFAAAVIRFTSINDQGVLMFGGRGGWNVTPSLTLGGGLYATVTQADGPEGFVPDSPGPLDIKLESFGLELEYAPHPAAPTHLVLYAFVGGGAGHYVRDNSREQHGETDFMLMLEPAAGVEQRISDWLHLNLTVSYRLASGVELPLLESTDLNGAAVTMAVKFGRF